MSKELIIKYFNDLIGGFNTDRWEKGSEADFINQAYNYICKIEQENQQLNAENYRLEHNEQVLLQRQRKAIDYIDQVIGYKPCAREIDEELNTLIGILRGGINE